VDWLYSALEADMGDDSGELGVFSLPEAVQAGQAEQPVPKARRAAKARRSEPAPARPPVDAGGRGRPANNALLCVLLAAAGAN